MNIVTLEDARTQGLRWYFTGIPCKHGHIAERRTNNNVCRGCEQAKRNFHPRGIIKHGLTDTSEHNIWCGMRKRCNNPNDKLYPYYGGRGIKICERWNDFENFLADMGARPSPQHSIERRDNDKGYEPGNCYWATRTEQTRNRRGNLYVTYRGETLCVTAWAERLGIADLTIRRRLRKGLSPEMALRPSRRMQSKRSAIHA